MKIFEGGPGTWACKTNFVDKNNVVVGFDSSQSCCEYFGYLITAFIPTSTSEEAEENRPEVLEPYVFDTAFVHNDAVPDSDGGGSVTFKLWAIGQPDLYLTLFNHHNGYYGHGFDMAIGDKVLHDGTL